MAIFYIFSMVEKGSFYIDYLLTLYIKDRFQRGYERGHENEDSVQTSHSEDSF